MRAAEVFSKAREADLPALWAAAGHPLGRSGNRLVSSFCPCCKGGTRKDRVSISKEDGTWRWRCFACDQGGTAVDFVARGLGIDPLDAARRIVEGSLPSTPVPDACTATRSPALSEEGVNAFATAMGRMRGYGLDRDVCLYLASRGLSEATARLAHASGLLVTLPADAEKAVLWLEANVGKSLMAQAGLWSKRWPAAAYRPLIFVGPTSEVAEFRSLGKRDGSPKAIQFGRQDYPLLLKPAGKVKRVVVVEGGVDLLSMMEMGEHEETLLVGLYGTGSWRNAWAKRIIAKYPAAEWRIATDADEDGETCALRIAQELGSLGVQAHQRWRPFIGNDWNDALKVIAA